MLPSISFPSFELTIPSNGKKIEYRPFLVKEEKILLMALEGQDRKEITLAIYKILENCILDKNIDIRKLPTFDIEYIFLMIRAKSVGEVITFTMGHSEDDECDHKTEVHLNLNDVGVVGDIGDGTIMITDSIGIQMHYPTIEAIDELTEDTDKIVSVIASCIDFVFDDSDVYEEYTREELTEWLGNLNSEQYEKINKFFMSSPKLKHTISWTCPKCKKEESVDIEGLYNFFM